MVAYLTMVEITTIIFIVELQTIFLRNKDYKN